MSEAKTGGAELYKDRDWLHEQYHELQKTQKEVAEVAGCSTSTIKRWMKRHDISTRSASVRQSDGDIEKLQDKDWLHTQYVEKELSSIDIAEKIGMTNDCVLDWLDRHGIESRSRSEAMSDGDVEKLSDESWMREKYVASGWTGPEIAEYCSVDCMTVYNWLRKHNIKVRTSGESMSTGKIDKVKNKEWLRKKYIDEKMGTKEIADLVGVSSNTVRTYIDQFNIPTRKSPHQKSDADLERLNDAEYLRTQHHEFEKSAREIANELRCAYTTVYRKMAQFNIERKGHEWGHPSGEDHPQHKPKKTSNYGPNWEEQKLKARIRDHCRCQVCGMHDGEHIEKYGRVNHVHHIDPRENYIDENGVLDYKNANRLDNLITLCNRHHKKIEGLPIDNRHL